MVSMGQELRQGITPSGWLTRLHSRCEQGLWSHLMAQMGKNVFPNSFMWLLLGCCTEPLIPHYLLAGEYSQIPAMWASTTVAYFITSKESASKTAITVYYNWIMEMTSHHLCHIISYKYATRSGPHWRGGESHKNMDTRMQAILEIHLPHIVIFQIWSWFEGLGLLWIY